MRAMITRGRGIEDIVRIARARMRGLRSLQSYYTTRRVVVTWYDERCVRVGFEVRHGKRMGCAHREEAGDGVVDRIGLRPSIVDEVEVYH
jgi:hypothetical protein